MKMSVHGNGSKSAWWNGIAWLIALAAAWGGSLFFLSHEWQTNTQYHYGWLVPPLALLLAWRRLAPAEHPLPSRPAHKLSRKAAFPIAVSLAFFLLALLLRETDPIWRLISHLQMAAATLLTMVWLHRIGGGPLLRRMAFPLLFLWTALPWPSMIETPITQGLMRLVTGVTVHLLNLGGIAALQQGNVIELSRGVVGLGVACSGIQSLQAGLMVALFLGALWGMGRRWRIGLLLAAAAVTLLVNLGRALLLSSLVGLHGMEALARFHDPTGEGMTAVAFVTIFLISLVMARELGKPAPWPSLRRLRLPLHLPGRDGWILVASLALLPWIAALWFAVRGAELRGPVAPLWSLRSPPEEGWAIESHPIDKETLRVLGCSTWDARFGRVGGRPFEIFHFFWRSGLEVPSLAVGHTPDICLPSAGWKLIQGPTPAQMTLHGVKVSAVISTFEQDGQRIRVFYAIRHGGKAHPFVIGSQSWYGRWDRFSMIWEGRYNRGYETLTLITPYGPEEKEADFIQRALEATLVPTMPLR